MNSVPGCWNSGNTSEASIPVALFAAFQLFFACVTTALVAGAAAGRMKFGAWMLFAGIWATIVYFPVAHWVFAFSSEDGSVTGGWIASGIEAIDFAGGTAVHMNAGAAALALALVLGKSSGWPKVEHAKPHSRPLVLVGAGLLWVGWFGFNGGSALTASEGAASAIVNTHVAASTAALVWLAIERVTFGKPTTVGFATGAIAGLATVTPAAGFISPGAAILFGAAAALVCYGAIQLVKNRWQIDDSLDVFAVHGVGGMLGSLMLGLFLSPALGGSGYAEGMAMGSMLGAQAVAVVVVAGWSALATAAAALAVSKLLPMRVSVDDERQGLDIASHGERGWEFD